MVGLCDRAPNSLARLVTVYHCGDTEKYLGEVDGLHAPLLVHLAEEDEFISKPAQAEIKEALVKKPDGTVYSYPVSVTHSRGTAARTTMPQQQRSPMA